MQHYAHNMDNKLYITINNFILDSVFEALSHSADPPLNTSLSFCLNDLTLTIYK